MAPSVHVVTFEPAPWNVDRIEEKLELNELEASIYDVALSVSSSTAELSILEETKGEQRHSIVETDDGETIPVDTRPGDEIAGTEEPIPNIVKIDVEGAEDMMIEGLSETLSDPDCRLVYCEKHHPDNNTSDTTDIEESLKSMGFELSSFQTAEHESILKAKR